MSRILRMLARGAVGLVVGGITVVLLAEASAAAPQNPVEGVDVVVPVTDGAGVEVGIARAAREATADGELALVELTVDGGYVRAALCVSDVPFTSPSAPGRCLPAEGRGPTQAWTFPIEAGAEVHVQVRVTQPGGVAYAGRQAGPPAYGSVAVPLLVQPAEGPPLPTPDELVEAPLADALTSDLLGVAQDDGDVEPPPDDPLPMPGCAGASAADAGAAASAGADGRAGCPARGGTRPSTAT